MWVIVKTLEQGVARKRLVNLDHVIKVRMTEETDGEYHTKHDGHAFVLLFKDIPTGIEKPVLEDYGVVGEILSSHISPNVCKSMFIN